MAEVRDKKRTQQPQVTFQSQRLNIAALRKESIEKRKEHLRKLRHWILNNRATIHKAAFDDFRKNPAEVDGVEIFHVIQEISFALNNLDQWTQPKKVDAPITMLGTRSKVYVEPRGVCLIIAPWNYPFSLAVGPLVSALAAGNAVIIKPSELTPHMSALLYKMVSELFDANNVSVIEGGPDVSRELLSLPFDHIFFTGSPAIGKVVMKAAAENLTSVTLELGGKSPTIITESASLQEAAKRTAVAKFINNGQTCIAPDYILVDNKVASKFIELLKEQISKLFLEAGETFESTSNYCRIVNDRHFARLNSLLQDALSKGAQLEFGGNVDDKTRFIHPVILSRIPPDSTLMDEEIFGPILPIITYNKLDEAITLINSKPKPLALYIFSNKKKEQERILGETSAGGVCINESAIHFLHHNLPFGGVNHSGIGKSHGYFGFLAFSNEKPVLRQRHGITSISPFYPPYTNFTRKLMAWILRWL